MTQFRVPVLENFAWQEPIIAISNGTGLTPTKGDRYIVGAAGGAFAAGTIGDIAWYDGTAWQFDTPSEGWRSFNKANDNFYFFDGSAWTNSTTLGDLYITGDISSETAAVDWTLKDNEAKSITFITDVGLEMLNFNTTDGSEAVEFGQDVQISGSLNIDGGSIDLVSSVTSVKLANGSTAAVSFDADGGTTGLLAIDTQNDMVTMAGSAQIVGDLTVLGTTTTISSNELVIEDPTITLNKGGGIGSAGGSGIEIEERVDSTTISATGFIKVAADRLGWELNAPANDFVLGIDATANSTLTMSGNLAVEAASRINQDVTDDADVDFNSVTLAGSTPLIFSAAAAVTLQQDEAQALRIDGGLLNLDTTTGAKKVTVGGALDVTGQTTLRGDINIINSTNVVLKDNDAASLAFDAAGAAGIMVFDTTDGAEKVKFGKDLAVTGNSVLTGTLGVTGAATLSSTLSIGGDLTLQGGGGISDNGTDVTLGDNLGNTVSVLEAQTAYDSRAQYDADLGTLLFDAATIV
jgi:hypothetical protein